MILVNFELRTTIDRAKYLLKYSRNNAQYFFYAALEIRFAMEIFLKGWLEFTIRGSNPLSDYIKKLYGNDMSQVPSNFPENEKIINELKRSKNLYSVKDFHNKILVLAPFFEKRIEFMTLLEPIFGKMKSPDFKKLNKYYGRIGAFLHLPRFKFIEKKMLEELNEILDYVEKNYDSHRCFISFTKDGELLFDKFLNNNLTDEELKEIKENGSNYHNGGIFQFS